MRTIFEELHADHDRHSRLMSTIETLQGDSGTRHSLFVQLCIDLNVHAALEAAVLYAPMLEAEMTREVARHSIVEHQDMERIMVDLEEMAFDHPAWLVTFRRLKVAVEQHEHEEEGEVFQLAETVLPEHDPFEIGLQLHNAKY